MDLFSILTMIGGLALFLYGMNVMGDGLVKMSGGRLEQLLEKLTSNRIKGLLLGAGVTAVIQSSSATTVMVVGFVNSGIMKLTQAVGIIMGANVGTTITSWILSLTGIQSGNVFIRLLKPSSFSPILAAIGIIMIMMAKGNSKKKDIGGVLVGFAVLMFGMETMSGAVAPLADNPAFTGLFTTFSNPILGMIAGAVLTAVIQSSSASVGILQALCVTGAVSYGSAIPIIIGQNIGTCVTALISSAGAAKNAKRAAMIHLYFNLIGSVVFMAVFYSLNGFMHFGFLTESANAVGIAIVHSLFNVGCALVLFPFGDKLVKLAEVTIPDRKQEAVDSRPAELIALDERFLDQPGYAVSLCKNAAVKMARTSKEAILLALDTFENYSEKKMERVVELENEADLYEDTLGGYLVKLSSRNLTTEDSRWLSILLHCINDFERISDHAVNVAESAKDMHDKGLYLSGEGKGEVHTYTGAIRDIIEMTEKMFEENNVEEADNVAVLEEVIDDLTVQMKQLHIQRLRSGRCSMETGLILEDIITDYERVSDHCMNIAACLVEIRGDGFETHEYKKQSSKGQEWFANEVKEQQKKYILS